MLNPDISIYPDSVCRGSKEGCLMHAFRAVFAGKASKKEAQKLMSNLEKNNWDIEKITVRLKEISTLMHGIDFRSMRPMRAVLVGTATSEDKKELKELEESAQLLRSEATYLVMLQADLREKEIEQ